MKRLILLLLAAVMTISAAGCSRSENAENTQSSLAPETGWDTPLFLTEAETEPSVPVPDSERQRGLSFDFREAAQNITLKGQKITLPCTVDEPSEDFRLATYGAFIGADGENTARLTLYHGDENLGMVYIFGGKNDGGSIVYGLMLWSYFDMLEAEIAGITFENTGNEIVEKLGPPGEPLNQEAWGRNNYIYRLSEDEYICFSSWSDYSCDEMIIVVRYD